METPNRVLTKRRQCLSQICKRRILHVFTSYFANKRPHCIFPQLHPNKSLLRRAGVQPHSLGLSRAARWPPGGGGRSYRRLIHTRHTTILFSLIPPPAAPPTPFGAYPKYRAPAPARRAADTHLQGSRAGKATAALRPSPGGEPEPSARLTTGPAASRARRPHPPPSFPHGTQHPRPPCSEPVGKARQTARYLPGRSGPCPAPAAALRGRRPPPLPALRPAPP